MPPKLLGLHVVGKVFFCFPSSCSFFFLLIIFFSDISDQPAIYFASVYRRDPMCVVGLQTFTVFSREKNWWGVAKIKKRKQFCICSGALWWDYILDFRSGKNGLVSWNYFFCPKSESVGPTLLAIWSSCFSCTFSRLVPSAKFYLNNVPGQIFVCNRILTVPNFIWHNSCSLNSK